MKLAAAVLACMLVMVGCGPSQPTAPGTRQLAAGGVPLLQARVQGTQARLLTRRVRAPEASFITANGKAMTLQRFAGQVVVAFLRNALTDPRVAWERAPFDHPSLVIPDGHIGDEIQVAGQQSINPKIVKRAQDVQRHVPAVGKDGRAAKVGPLQPYHSNLR